MTARKILFQFPGQGSQYRGMGSDLVADFATAREVYERASTVLGYDLAKLSAEQGIVVRRARAGETLKTLDGQTRSLVAEDLLITSGGRAVAIAGVMGGEDSGVGGDTRAVFLESAAFAATGIRRTSTRLGLRTDASTRYEKALDPTLADLNRLAALIAENPDLTRLVRSPIFSTGDQMRAMRAVLDKAGISGLVANLVFVTVRNRRLFALPGIAAAFRKLVARYGGETSAEVTSAEPLSPC